MAVIRQNISADNQLFDLRSCLKVLTVHGNEYCGGTPDIGTVGTIFNVFGLRFELNTFQTKGGCALSQVMQLLQVMTPQRKYRILYLDIIQD